MPMAFVFINAEVGSEEEALNSLKGVEGVEEACLVYGVHDIVAKVKAESLDKLKDIVTGHIRRLNKVRLTQTVIVVEGI